MQRENITPFYERKEYKAPFFINDVSFFYLFIKIWEGEPTMKESKFQAELKKELKKMFPGCIVTKLDSSDIQGIPDLLVLYKNKWATLENKRSKNSPKRPNQEYYVEKMNDMSFSRFIYPENKDEVLNELKDIFDI